jgi:putative ABC transport system permease protein
MFFRLLTNSLARRMSRKLLAAFAVWVGISLILAFLAVSIDVGDKMNRELQAFGSNIRMEPVAVSVPVRVGGHDVPSTAPPAYLEEGDLVNLKRIFWKNNILGVVPRLWTHGRAGGREIPLLGVWIENKIPVEGGEPFVTGARRVYKHWRVQGAWPSDDPARGEIGCLVGDTLARKLGIRIGEKIRVTAPSGPATIAVAGIASTGGREDDAIILPLAAAQALAGLEGKYSEADVSALTTPENKLAEMYRQDPKSLTPAEYERWFCTPYPGSVAAEIQKSVPGSAARVVRKVSETQGAILTRIEGLMFLLAMLTLVACCLSVAGVLTSAVLERRAEVALMQAIGASRESVLLLFLSEGAVLGLAGGLLAAATGSFLGQWLVRAVFGSEPELHPALAVLSPFLGLLIVLAGSIWPVWQALHQDTATVLHGN